MIEDQQDLVGKKEIRDQLVLQDQVGQLVLLVSKVSKDQKDLRETKDKGDQQVLQDLKEAWAHLAHKDRVVSVEKLVRVVKLDQVGLLDL